VASGGAAMLIGPVHAAAGSPIYNPQGLLPTVVHGQVLPLDPDTGFVQRSDTSLVVSRFRNMSKFVLCSGICSANLYLLISTCYVWFAMSIPKTCNVRLSEVFIGLGFLNGVMGLIMGCFLYVAQTMLSAMTHSAIAAKYRCEGRDEEADSQESDYETEASLASRSILLPTCMYMVALNAMLVCWGFGCVQALQVDDDRCGGAGFIFWVLLLVNVSNCCVSGASGTSVYQAPEGRVF